MRFTKVIGIALSIVVICIAAFMVVTVNAQDSSNADEPVTLFIGTVTDFEDEFVGLAIDGENVTIYICDGQADKGTISIGQWFIGIVADNAIDITAANGNRVEVTLDEETATGKFTFTDGTVKEFVLRLAEGGAALYRSEFAFGEDEYVGGWLVLEDGSVRGSVFNKQTAVLVPASFNANVSSLAK
jgi:hypothetical protein